jgi:thiol:disulfide interchange protein DsbD
MGAVVIASGVAAALAAKKSLGMGKIVFGGMSVVTALALIPLGTWLFAGPYLLASDGALPPPAKVFASKIDWQLDHDAALARAREAGKPVMVDFTARYCLPCRELDATTYRDEEVLRALHRFVAVKLDATDPSGENARLKLEVYKAPYWPYIAFYDSHGRRLDALAFQGKPSKEELLARLKEID